MACEPRRAVLGQEVGPKGLRSATVPVSTQDFFLRTVACFRCLVLEAWRSNTESQRSAGCSKLRPALFDFLSGQHFSHADLLGGFSNVLSHPAVQWMVESYAKKKENMLIFRVLFCRSSGSIGTSGSLLITIFVSSYQSLAQTLAGLPLSCCFAVLSALLQLCKVWKLGTFWCRALRTEGKKTFSFSLF